MTQWKIPLQFKVVSRKQHNVDKKTIFFFLLLRTCSSFGNKVQVLEMKFTCTANFIPLTFRNQRQIKEKANDWKTQTVSKR